MDIEGISESLSEISIAEPNSQEDTWQYLVRIIFGIIFIVFFLVYCICMFLFPYLYDKKSEANDDVYELKKDIKLIALHFTTMAVAVIFGFFLLFFRFSLLHLFILIAFVIFWIAYIIVFFKSDTFHYITGYYSPFQNIYSYDQYQDLWSKWNKINPNIKLQYHDDNVSHSCQSASFTFLSKNSINVNNKPEELNIDEKTGKNPALYIIKFNLEVEWELESEQKITQLENKIKGCPTKSSDTKISISKKTILPDLFDSILITQDGKIPPKFTPKNVILFGIFWAGVRVNFDLRSISFKIETIKKTNSIISDDNINQFSCNQLTIKCWDKAMHAECIPKQNNKYPIPQKTPTNENIGYSRERLSRAFYLSDASYGDFTQFSNKNEKKVYKWSKPLVESFIKKSQINGFCLPHYYVGKYKNEIWIMVRGSHSTYDWITDGKAITKHLISGKYHLGFYQAGINIWKDIAEIFIDEKYKDCAFYFTGHSYGGAVATVLHKIASHCFPDKIDRMFTFSFGAPPSMGQKTSKPIKDHVYAFINAHDCVPRLSINTVERMLIFGSVMLNYAKSNDESETTKKTLENTLKVVLSEGYDDDIISRPIGNIYHLTHKKWQKKGKLKIEQTLSKDFLMIPFINFFGAIDHTMNNYASKFLLYKDGVMQPTEFDTDAVVNTQKSFNSNMTIYEIMNIDDPRTMQN